MYGFTPTRTHRFHWAGTGPRRIIGVLSGTSADAVDAVLVDVRALPDGLGLRQRAFVTLPYPRSLRDAILANSLPGTGTVDEICRLNVAVGLWFSRAVRRVARAARVPLSSVDLVGSHGQTVHHLPDPTRFHGLRFGSTLQIGDPSLIAQETGIPTVGDFRAADVAAGGQGAPLAPYLDYLLFRSRTRSRLLLNLGGIANFTVIPRGAPPDRVIAFDTGPANMVIDALTQRWYHAPFDNDGARAARGRVQPELLRSLMRHPYLRRKPPKSTGREMFGADYVERLIRSARTVARADIVATATEFTARSVFDQYRRFVARSTPVDEVFVSGGGAHNRTVMRRLADHFAPIPVHPVMDLGFSVDAKEAILFAVLARATALGQPSNLTSVTGARRPVVLGKICLP